MSHLGLTTWSLHRSMGPLRWTKWDDEKRTQVTAIEDQPTEIALLDLPAMAAANGFQSLDVCHFHFPETSKTYLTQLREAFQQADISFYTLLVDYGDISSSDDARQQSDIAFIKEWIDVASIVGAQRVRVVAGDGAPTDAEAVAQSGHALNELLAYGKYKNVQIVTENFRSLSSTVENCLKLRELCDADLRFIADFGNMKSAHKYDDLATILAFADNAHVKTQYDPAGEPNAPELKMCLESARRAKFEGSFTVVYDGPGDEWAGIQRVQKLIEPCL